MVTNKLISIVSCIGLNSTQYIRAQQGQCAFQHPAQQRVKRI